MRPRQLKSLSSSWSHPGIAEGLCWAAVSNGCSTGQHTLLLMSAAQVLFNGSFIINGSVALFAFLGSCGYFPESSPHQPWLKRVVFCLTKGIEAWRKTFHHSSHQCPGIYTEETGATIISYSQPCNLAIPCQTISIIYNQFPPISTCRRGSIGAVPDEFSFGFRWLELKIRWNIALEVQLCREGQRSPVPTPH